jgi:anti-sigma factor RsiW
MKCPAATDVLEPYVDSELDLTRAVEFERHLASCPDCSSQVDSLRALRKRLQSPDMRFEAPAALKKAILDQTRERVQVRAPRSFFFFAAAAATLIVVVLSSAYLMQQRGAEKQTAKELTSAHVRSLMVNHLIDVESTDQHTVKPWFEGKIDFAPKVDDYAEQGYPLVGGRLDYVNGRNVAVVVYRRRQHPINIFEWPARDASEARPKNQVSDGFNLVHWRSDGMEFWAASDLNYNELAALVQLIQEHKPAAPSSGK